MNEFSCIREENMMENKEDGCQEQCFHPEVVESVRRDMLGSVPSDELAQLFKVLGDDTRIKILDALFRSELCVCDLTALLGMNQSAVSHQLRVLRDARIVKSRKQGKNVLYSLDDEHISGLVRMGSEHVRELKR
jgi:DNA-binding transcriptional ArsR family regulator